MGQTFSSAEIIRLLEGDGWRLVRVKGSHHQYRHPTKPGVVTVPHPKRELPKGTAQSVFRAARIRPGKR